MRGSGRHTGVKARPVWVTVAVALVAIGIRAEIGEAQDKGNCRILCSPEVKFEPTVTIENLFRRPRVARLEDGEPVEFSQLERETEFEVILAVGVPTEIPRVGFTFEAIWTPFGGADTNVFTGATADQLGVSQIRDNPVELEFELNLHLLEAEQAGGWVETHFDIVDQFSPAERPRDRGVYTHKLNFELDTAIFVFNWLPNGNWLRNLELELSLDYLPTGIPQAGDVLRGEELFLTAASPWSLSILAVIPIAPLHP
ncbi:MAG: hypothetical protein ACRD1R_03735 [Acidobacteriota bacterium]